MKQRYLISRDEKTSELTIEEYAVIAGNLKRHEVSAFAEDGKSREERERELGSPLQARGNGRPCYREHGGTEV